MHSEVFQPTIHHCAPRKLSPLRHIPHRQLNTRSHSVRKDKSIPARSRPPNILISTNSCVGNHLLLHAPSPVKHIHRLVSALYTTSIYTKFKYSDAFTAHSSSTEPISPYRSPKDRPTMIHGNPLKGCTKTPRHAKDHRLHPTKPTAMSSSP
jgi:hypothetical protein